MAETRPAGLSISAIEFSGGDRIELQPDTILVIVGPNNVGKSATLYGLDQILRHRNHSPVVRSVSTRRHGTPEALRQYMRSAYQVRIQGDAATVVGARNWNEQALLEHWSNPSSDTTNFNDMFLTRLEAAARVQMVELPQRINYRASLSDHPGHAIDRVESDELRLSALFHEAFGQDLVLDRGAGAEMLLRVGCRPVLLPGQRHLDEPYNTQVGNMDALAVQGDGMKSYVACLLHALVRPKSITLIDEPEAFLHPPQIRMLAQQLTKNLPQDSQLLVATHSTDFVLGVLGSAPNRLMVARMTRTRGGPNRVKVLDATTLNAAWQDASLRFSRVLDGLFYERTILCEGDADCRFYAALASCQAGASDWLFAPTGGKDKLPTVAGALRALGVRTSIIGDFDVLREEPLTKRLAEACGLAEHSWLETYQHLIRVLNGAMRARPTAEVKQEILKVLDRGGQIMTESLQDGVRSAVKTSTPWSDLRVRGTAAVPPGEATRTCRALLAEFSQVGLHLVPVGELESWDRSIDGRSTEWVAAALTKDVCAAPEMEPARRFVQDVLAREVATPPSAPA